LQRSDQLFCRIDHLAVNRANHGANFELDFLATETVLGRGAAALNRLGPLAAALQSIANA